VVSQTTSDSVMHAAEPDRKDVAAAVKNLSVFKATGSDPVDWLRGIHLILMSVKNMSEDHLPHIIFNQLFDPGVNCGQKFIRMLNQEQITLQKCTWQQFQSVFRSTFVSPDYDIRLRGDLSRLKMKVSDHEMHACQLLCLELEKLYRRCMVLL
jgi:hypothetical protein